MDPPLVNHEDSYSATHPSDHNSVAIDSRHENIRRERRRDAWKCKRDEEKQKMEESTRKGKKKASKEIFERGQKHEAAFMVPVPLTYESAKPPHFTVKLCAAVGHFELMKLQYLRADDSIFSGCSWMWFIQEVSRLDVMWI